MVNAVILCSPNVRLATILINISKKEGKDPIVFFKSKKLFWPMHWLNLSLEIETKGYTNNSVDILHCRLEIFILINA